MVSLKVRLSDSLVASFIPSSILSVFGDQVAQASTPPESIAVTIAEASMSTASTSLSFIPSLASVLSKISSLEVPEE